MDGVALIPPRLHLAALSWSTKADRPMLGGPMTPREMEDGDNLPSPPHFAAVPWLFSGYASP